MNLNVSLYEFIILFILIVHKIKYSFKNSLVIC